MKLNRWVCAFLLLAGCQSVQPQKNNTSTRQVSQEAEATSYQFISFPAANLDALINLLKQAKTEVKMMMYHLSHEDIVNQIAASAQSGVKFQILLDHNDLAVSSSQIAVNTLKNSAGAANIEIKPSSTGFSITHTKALLIDQKTLMVSTINFSHALPHSRDLGLVWSDQQDIDEFNRVFAADWQQADTNGNATPELSSTRLLWSNVNSQTKLLDLINQSQSTLDLEVENLGSTEIQNALLAAISQRKVQVRLVMSLCTAGTQQTRNWPFINTLAAGGVQVRVMPQTEDFDHPYIHAKFIIADNQKVYIGSENFSYNSLNMAREVGAIVSSSDVVQKTNQIFLTDWTHAQDWGTVKQVCVPPPAPLATPAPTLPPPTP